MEASEKSTPKKTESIGCIIVFLAILAVFTLITLLRPRSDFSVTENRALAMRPEFDADDMLSGDFQEAYEESLSDQFVARAAFVSLKSELSVLAGKKDIGGVWLGKDGYLIEKFEAADFDPELAEENEDALAAFLSDAADRYGAEHVHALFVPSKGSVLTDKLPSHAVVCDTSGLAEQVRGKLAATYAQDGAGERMLCDLGEELSSHGEEYIYYRTDHHWTTLGAFYAANAFRRLCGEVAEPLSAYEQTVVSEDFFGTGYDKVQRRIRADAVTRFDRRGQKEQLTVDQDYGGRVSDSCYDEDALSEKDQYRYFFGGNTACIHIASDAGTGRTLLLLKDSYSNCFVPFLTRDYSDIYMIDLRYTTGRLSQELDRIGEKRAVTDVLVMYNREKFLQDTNLWKLTGT